MVASEQLMLTLQHGFSVTFTISAAALLSDRCLLCYGVFCDIKLSVCSG